MTKKQRLIKEKEHEIREAEMRLDELRQQRKMLDEFPDLDYDEPLENIDDFPFKKGCSGFHFGLNWAIGVRDENGRPYKATVNDLIYASPEKILRGRLIGTKKLKKIMEWMEKHNLKFIS